MTKEVADMLTEMLKTNLKSTKNWVKKNKKCSMEEFEELVRERYAEYKEKRKKK